jgi:D-glycero-D-manno-heptose 1,7-bisphosphate phosphatase
MKLIILDRDGVINQDSGEYVKSAKEWEAIPGSLPAIARLNQNGYRVVVMSNQSGLARKKLDIIDLNEIHRKMLDHLSQYGGNIDAVFFCPHGPKENCECRKPKPGLLKEISKRLHTSLTDVPVVGDKLSDIKAALAVGARPMLVLTGYGQETLDSKKVPKGIPVFNDLAAVVDNLIPAK